MGQNSGRGWNGNQSRGDFSGGFNNNENGSVGNVADLMVIMAFMAVDSMEMALVMDLVVTMVYLEMDFKAIVVFLEMDFKAMVVFLVMVAEDVVKEI